MTSGSISAGVENIRRALVSIEIGWPMRIAVALLLLSGAFLLFGGVLSWLLAPGPEIVGYVDESFNEGFLFHPDWVNVSGFTPCLDGWCLPPGGSGTLVYRPGLPLDRVQDVRLHLWFYLPAGGTNRFLLSTDGGRSFQTIAANLHAVGRRISLTPYVNKQKPFLLLFEASNASPHQALVLDKLSLVYLSSSLVLPPSHQQFFLWFLSFGLAGVVLCRRRPVALLSLLIIAVGATLRYGVLAGSVDFPLDPDAQGYRLYAHRMSLFTDTGFFSAQFSEREPMFVFVVHNLFKLIGESDFHLRLVSFLLSIVVIWLVIRIGQRLFGVWAGWVMGLLVAVNRPLGIESARGLRLELEMIVLLIYVFCAVMWKGPKGMPRAIILGIMGGLLLLTRTTYLPALLPLQLLAHYRDRRESKEWLKGATVSILIMIALVIPHRYNMYRIHGDPFWDTSGYARWNANVEFVGQPGFPAREQLNINAYVGPRITYLQYMFGMHSLREIVTGTFRGYVKLFRKMEECAWGVGWLPFPCGVVSRPIQTLAVVGLLLACFSWTSLWLPVTFILVEFPVAFLYDRGLVEPYRHSFPGFPFVLFAAALTIVLGLRTVGKYVMMWRHPRAKGVGDVGSRTGGL